MSTILGPDYTMVEKYTGRSKSLVQDMVIWGKGRYAVENENNICTSRNYVSGSIRNQQEIVGPCCCFGRVDQDAM